MCFLTETLILNLKPDVWRQLKDTCTCHPVYVYTKRDIRTLHKLLVNAHTQRSQIVSESTHSTITNYSQ